MSTPPTDTHLEALPSWAQGLGLVPHPEGGWFAETYRSPGELPAEQLPGYDLAGSPTRPFATAITFLLLPGEVSAWHVVRSDELWIHQRGGPLLLGYGGTDPAGPVRATEALLGTDGTAGQLGQRLVPAGTWQTARPVDEAALVACVVAPGFDYRDWRLAP